MYLMYFYMYVRYVINEHFFAGYLATMCKSYSYSPRRCGRGRSRSRGTAITGATHKFGMVANL